MGEESHLGKLLALRMMKVSLLMFPSLSCPMRPSQKASSLEERSWSLSPSCTCVVVVR